MLINPWCTTMVEHPFPYRAPDLLFTVNPSVYFQSDEVTAPEHTRNCLGVHHSLASRATDYIKRPFVFRFVTSDWREFLFQAKYVVFVFS